MPENNSARARARRATQSSFQRIAPRVIRRRG